VGRPGEPTTFSNPFDPDNIMNLNRLLDRLRMQGLIQRLIREHGDEVAQEIIAAAVEIELVRKQPAKSKLRS
jgi:hypothetical protein